MKNSPLAICNICLRSDRNLLHLDDELESFYGDFCDYIHLSSVSCCAECQKRLKNCYDFKNRCVTAAKKFKVWRKEKASERKSIDLLHAELPANLQLNLSLRKNFKIHLCHAESESIPIETNSNHSHILNIDIPPTENGNTETNNESNTEIVKEELDFVAFDNNEDVFDTQKMDVFEVKIETDHTSDDSDIEPDNINTEKSNKPLDSGTESDDSLNEFIAKYKTDKESKKNIETNKVKKKKWLVDINKLRDVIKEKFESKTVIDGKGNAIDMDIVLHCFDKLSVRKLYNIKKHCTGKGPFTPTAIEMLSELHEEYAMYHKMNFNIQYMHDDAQMRIEFEKRLESSEYVESKHRCDTCIRGFKKRSQLKEHIVMAHNTAYGFECKLCKTRCKTNPVLQSHMKGHRLLYKCNVCPFVTSHKNAIKGHCDRHAGAKYTCKDCGEQFDGQTELHCHYRRTHKTSHLCVFCAFASVSKMGLIFHKTKKHKDEQFIESESNRRCESCDVNFITEDVYQKHLRISHGLKNYTNRKPTTCHLCGASGNGGLWLSHHIKTLHPGAPLSTKQHSHLCDTCGKGFHNVTIYKDHLNVHTGARPYSCPHCPKTFQRLLNLYVHKKRHLPPAHVCTYCGKKFATWSNLYTHTRTHTGDRCFKCEICGKGFLQNCTLKEHVNAVHYNIKKKRASKIT